MNHEEKLSESVKPSNLDNFIQSIKSSIETKNYFSALIIALTLPDICCSIEDTNRRSGGEKYAKWFERYVQNKYTSKIGYEQTEHIFLNGYECYALRCTYLHKGMNEIINEKILKKLKKKSKKIEFMAEMRTDQCSIGDVLILKLETFCENIISGVDSWLNHVSKNPVVAQRIKDLPQVHTKGFFLSPGVFIE